MTISRLASAVLILAALVHGARAAETVPEVYQDEYLTVRAGVPQVGVEPVHVGDAMTLSIELDFDGGRLQVEDLDGEFFQRAFADRQAFELYAEPAVKRIDGGSGRVTLQASWTFQILDCPGERAQCAGSKVYELPIMAVAYRLIDDAGNTVNDKSVRFRPWPGNITITPSIAALSGSAEEFADFFPGGAYQEALPVADRHYAAFVAAFTGALFLGIAIRRSFRKLASIRDVVPAGETATRWQAALACLESGNLDDARWADALRRSAAWFCLDELHCNPYAWLASGSSQPGGAAPPPDDFRAFIADLLDQECIEPQRREDYLRRFARLTETAAPSGAREKHA
jgi:hypothetical protein